MGAQPEALRADVLVVGGGPAGAAAAIGLAQAGRRVVLAARDAAPRDPIGESLAPGAAGVLRALGVWDDFTRDGHLPCHANKSSWGDDVIRYHDFLRDPRGHGWHIDRARFEQRLTARAEALGVTRIASPRGGAIRRVDRGFRLEVTERAIEAAFAVDATGRARWLARRLGVPRREDDGQVAVTAFLADAARPLEDSASLVEAVEDGWWYSAALPGGRLATAFFTDPDPALRRATTGAGWRARLERAPHTHARVIDHGFALPEAAAIVGAGSARLERFTGDAWLAVGDAAMSYDPLSAHGLTVALTSGRDAAAAIVAHLGGDRSALASYDAQLEAAFAIYASMRRDLYRAERRWPDAPYWRRRATPT